ncbi:hypothetical protein RclHR1_06250001, partial [Rhizophagus clarus]
IEQKIKIDDLYSQQENDEVFNSKEESHLDKRKRVDDFLLSDPLDEPSQLLIRRDSISSRFSSASLPSQ